MKYVAVYERDPDGRWTVEIPKVKGCHTCGRAVDQARERIREALGLFVDDADSADIVDDVRPPSEFARRVARAKALRTEFQRCQQEMVNAQVDVVTRLRKDTGLGIRDGRILGRVSSTRDSTRDASFRTCNARLSTAITRPEEAVNPPER